MSSGGDSTVAQKNREGKLCCKLYILFHDLSKIANHTLLDYLNSICPEFFAFKEILGSSYTDSPLVQGSSTLNEVRITREDALREEEGQEIGSSSSDDSDADSPTPWNTDAEEVMPSTSKRKFKRVGERIDFEHVSKKVKEENEKSLQFLRDIAEFTAKKNVELKERQEKRREKSERLQHLHDIKTRNIYELARIGGWSTEKTKEELDAVEKDLYGNTHGDE